MEQIPYWVPPTGTNMFFEDELTTHARNGAPQGKLVIGLAFLRADEYVLNHCVTKMQSCIDSSPILHVEIYFPKTEESCSVDYDRPVHFRRDKNYYTRHWKWIYIEVEEREYNVCYNYCRSKCDQPFDRASIWLFCFGSCCAVPRREPKSWNCSRLIATSLKRAHILPTCTQTEFISPGKLYVEVSRLERESDRFLLKTVTGLTEDNKRP